jgi:hypothetical protein
MIVSVRRFDGLYGGDFTEQQGFAECVKYGSLHNEHA